MAAQSALAAGRQAYRQGIPLYTDRHPHWQAGWQDVAHQAGRQAHADGLPDTAQAHRSWRRGWRYAQAQIGQ